jgi:tRNA 2-thiouridine synthesizing protein A
MTKTTLDLTGLKCPLPALKTRKALKAIAAGDFLEVHCTDPLSVIDIPNLIRETGDKVDISERGETRIVFLIEKANDSIEKSNGAPPVFE